MWGILQGGISATIVGHNHIFDVLVYLCSTVNDVLVYCIRPHSEALNIELIDLTLKEYVYTFNTHSNIQIEGKIYQIFLYTMFNIKRHMPSSRVLAGHLHESPRIALYSSC